MRDIPEIPGPDVQKLLSVNSLKNLWKFSSFFGGMMGTTSSVSWQKSFEAAKPQTVKQNERCCKSFGLVSFT